MAPQQTAKFRTAFLVNFFTSLRNDSVANYASIWTVFSPTVRGLDVRFIVISVDDAIRVANLSWKFSKT